MKKFLAMTLLSSAFLASVGCQTPPTTTTTTPPTKASTAPATTPSAAPSSAMAPSAAPSAASSTAPAGAASTAPVGAASTAPAAGVEKMAEVKHPETGITMNLPEAWKNEAKDKDHMVVTKPDGNVALIFSMVEEDKMDEFNKNLDKEVGKYVIDQKLDEGSQKAEEINGLKSFTVRGTGKLKEGNKPVEWEIWMVNGGSHKILVMFGLGELKTNDATLSAIRKSVHKAEAAEGGDKTGESGDKGDKADKGDKGENKTEE